MTAALLRPLLRMSVFVAPLILTGCALGVQALATIDDEGQITISVVEGVSAEEVELDILEAFTSADCDTEPVVGWESQNDYEAQISDTLPEDLCDFNGWAWCASRSQSALEEWSLVVPFSTETEHTHLPDGSHPDSEATIYEPYADYARDGGCVWGWSATFHDYANEQTQLVGLLRELGVPQIGDDQPVFSRTNGGGWLFAIPPVEYSPNLQVPPVNALEIHFPSDVTAHNGELLSPRVVRWENALLLAPDLETLDDNDAALVGLCAATEPSNIPQNDRADAPDWFQGDCPVLTDQPTSRPALLSLPDAENATRTIGTGDFNAWWIVLGITITASVVALVAVMLRSLAADARRSSAS